MREPGGYNHIKQFAKNFNSTACPLLTQLHLAGRYNEHNKLKEEIFVTRKLHYWVMKTIQQTRLFARNLSMCPFVVTFCCIILALILYANVKGQGIEPLITKFHQ